MTEDRRFADFDNEYWDWIRDEVQEASEGATLQETFAVTENVDAEITYRTTEDELTTRLQDQEDDEDRLKRVGKLLESTMKADFEWTKETVEETLEYVGKATKESFL